MSAAFAGLVEGYRSGIDGVADEFVGERVEVDDTNVVAEQTEIGSCGEASNRGASGSFDPQSAPVGNAEGSMDWNRPRP